MFQIAALILATITSFNSFSTEESQTPTPVENFNIEKYQGKWHQLATIPASFQKSCIANTTAQYTLLPDGLLKVVNSCEESGGNIKVSQARARVNKDFGLNSTLEVTFVKIIKWIWSFGGDYWVIYINDSYDISIVGHPDYEYGWILSKREKLSLTEYKELSEQLIKQGYDSCEFKMSKTPEQVFENDISLCELVKESQSLQ